MTREDDKDEPKEPEMTEEERQRQEREERIAASLKKREAEVRSGSHLNLPGFFLLSHGSLVVSCG